MKRIIKKLLIAMLMFTAGIAAWVWTSISHQPAPGQPLFTPHVEANYVVSPLDDNGDVDYVAYMNQQASAGVTPDNNSAVKLIQAIGPHPDLIDLPPTFWHRLQMNPPQQDQPIFDDFDNWYNSDYSPSSDDLQVQKQLEQHYPKLFADWSYEVLIEEFCWSYPFDGKNVPAIEAFVQYYDKQFQWAQEAVDRAEYFVPLTRDSDGETIQLSIRLYSSFRQLARNFQVRSNYFLGQQNFEATSDDTFAIIKLSKHVADSHMFIDYLVAIAIRGIGFNQLSTVIQHPATSLDNLVELKKTIEKIRPLDRFSDIFEGERFYALANIQHILRSEGRFSDDQWDYLLDSSANLEILRRTSDPSMVMQTVNESFTIIQQIHRQKDFNPQFSLIDEWERFDQLLNTEAKRADNMLRWVFTTRRGRGRILGRALAGVFAPSCIAIYGAQERNNRQLELLKLMLEIEIFNRRHQKYPDQLTNLDPDQRTVLDAEDSRIAQGLVYQKTESRYRLYWTSSDFVSDEPPVPNEGIWSGYPDVQGFSYQPPIDWAGFLKQRAAEYQVVDESEFDDDFEF